MKDREARCPHCGVVNPIPDSTPIDTHHITAPLSSQTSEGKLIQCFNCHRTFKVKA